MDAYIHLPSDCAYFHKKEITVTARIKIVKLASLTSQTFYFRGAAAELVAQSFCEKYDCTWCLIWGKQNSQQYEPINKDTSEYYPTRHYYLTVAKSHFPTGNPTDQTMVVVAVVSSLMKMIMILLRTRSQTKPLHSFVWVVVWFFLNLPFVFVWYSLLLHINTTTYNLFRFGSNGLGWFGIFGFIYSNSI